MKATFQSAISLCCKEGLYKTSIIVICELLQNISKRLFPLVVGKDGIVYGLKVYEQNFIHSHMEIFNKVPVHPSKH